MPVNEEDFVLQSGQSNIKVIPTSAYIHIPFCRRRCYYCDFPVSVLGDSAVNNPSNSVESYVKQLSQEIKMTPRIGTEKLQTVFFGGGTPSLLSVEQLSSILQVLEEYFGIAKDAEISLEVDPGTFTLKKIQGYKQAGVNRLSLGVQAFQDELLTICGRSHSTTDIFTAVELIQQGGITNLSLDLISGLPHQSLSQWQASLTTAVALGPNHLSCYDLVLERVTAFGKQYEPGIKPLPSDETTAKMYRLAQEILTGAGYVHYEISNYSKPEFQCRHNQVYWQNKPYYGFGMGAASYVESRRFTRPRTRREYYDWLQSWQEQGRIITYPISEQEDVLLETLMLGLRLRQGISLGKISRKFGEEVLPKIHSCLQNYYGCGWVQVKDENGEEIEIINRERLPHIGYLCLSDPEGFLFSNTVLSALFNCF